MRYSLEVQGPESTYVPVVTSAFLSKSIAIQGSADISVNAQVYPSFLISPSSLWGYGGLSQLPNTFVLQQTVQEYYHNYDWSKISFWTYFSDTSLHLDSYSQNGDEKSYQINAIGALLSNVIYTIQIWAFVDVALTQNNPGSTDTITVAASAFVDPSFVIDPSFPDAGQYSLALSAGVGNALAVPEPAMTPFLALLLGGGLARRVFARRRSSQGKVVALRHSDAARSTGSALWGTAP
jgi:hypothetical protein